MSHDDVEKLVLKLRGDVQFISGVSLLNGLLTLVLLICVFALAAKGADLQRVSTTTDAVGWALSDLAKVPEADRPFVRYVWIPPWGNERWIPAVNFAVNTAASQSAVIHLGTPVANGWLLRYDLQQLAPSNAQLAKLIDTWDGLAIQDAYFHVPSVNTGIRAAVLAPHLKQSEAAALAGLSFSTGAIYRADFLIVYMLSTLEGGRYYDFQQIDRNPKGGGTPQDVWLATLGIFEGQTKRLPIPGDQRSALFRSNVTGKPRRIDAFYGIGRGGPLATITHDITDEDVQAGQHPIRNLLAFDDAAREIIVQRPNGLHAFALTNDKGQFVDAAPDNVVRDFTVPVPHTNRLQPAISCIRCHGPHDGYQPFGNDVQRILSTRLDVFSDLSVDGVVLTRKQAVDRLAGLYAGQLDIPDGPIGRARRDYLSAAFRLYGGLPQFDPRVSVVAEVTGEVSSIYGEYRYEAVTPERACLELGARARPGEGINVLAVLLGDASTVVSVDPIEGSLRAGIAVNRSDFDAVAGDMAVKASQNKGVNK